MSSRKKRQGRKVPADQPSRAAAKRQTASTQERERFYGLYDGLKFDAAQRDAESLTQRYPEDAFGWKVLGSCLHKNGYIDASYEALEKSLTLDPNNAQAQHLMARACFDLGDPTRALEYVNSAINLEQNFAQAHFTRSEILAGSDRDDEALASLEKARSLNYHLASCLLARLELLSKKRYYQQALETSEELLQQLPNNALVQNQVGNLYKDLGQFENAESAYRKALSLDPSMDTAFCNLIVAMHYNPDINAEHIRTTIGQWASQFAHAIKPRHYTAEVENANKTIRIGLVSSGFRNHPVGHMTVTALENLGTGFELHFYSTNNADDVMTQRLGRLATSWHLVRHLDDEALASKIHEDCIDILFDLSGFGEGQCLRVMQGKPAPLIVKWVGGLINTMGLECYDYLLSDNYETPEGTDEYYAEKLIRMPDDYICYLPAPDRGPLKALPAIYNDYITLGCFNNPAKINTTLLAEWAKLMHELPNSRLFLKSGQYESTEYSNHIRHFMSEHGIESERLIMEGPSKHDELLEAYNRVDIALDTWPYSGGLTTCEAFIMGVPVVTLTGPTFAGRHSATHLINAGMPELVTFTWEEYRQKVVELASDLPNLSVIRACLRRFLMQSPVCDAEKFGKNFSNAMRAIWQRHCEGKAPAALTLDQKGQAFFEDSPEPVAIKKHQPALEQNGFNWDFEGKIIAVDNGGQLLNNPTVKSLLDQDLMEIIVFDPASHAASGPMSQYEGVHYFAHNGLGDGKPGTLNICSDPAMTSLLEPLSDEQSGNEKNTNEVVSREPFNTVTLNSLDGLPSLDWLVLDDLSDSAAILEHGSEALKDTLLIQIKVAFQPTHERQPNLAEVQHWASRNGFRFYRLNTLQHRSQLPDNVPLAQRQSTELTSADVLILPNRKNLAGLALNHRKKVVFILHKIYGIKDLPYSIIKECSQSLAENFIAKEIIKTDGKNKAIKSVLSPAAPAIPSENHIKGEPLVTIICSTYNHVEFIDDALSSFVSQETNFPFQVIVHDDASTDGTQEVIKKYTQEYPNIFTPILQKENTYSKNKSNAAEIRNNTKGRYIAFCEGDDYWTDSQKLQIQFDFMEANPEYSVCYHDSFTFKGEVLVSESKLPSSQKKDFSQQEMIYNNCFLLSNTRFCRNKFYDEHLPEGKMMTNGDNLTICRMGLAGKGKYLEQIKPAAYRIHGNSVWSSLSAIEQMLTLSNSYNWISRYLERKGYLSYAQYYRGKAEALVGGKIEIKSDISELNEFIRLGKITIPSDIVELSEKNSEIIRGSNKIKFDNNFTPKKGYLFIEKIDSKWPFPDRCYKLLVISNTDSIYKNSIPPFCNELIRITDAIILFKNTHNFKKIEQELTCLFKENFSNEKFSIFQIRVQ